MHPFLTRLVLPAVVAAALAVTAAPARAGFVVTTQVVATAPGDTGFLDVTLHNNGSTALSLSAFSFEMTVSGSGVQFTGLDANTLTVFYVFGGDSFGLLPSGTLPTSDLTASDLSASAQGYVDVAAGDRVGLARVAYQVDSGAAAGSRSVDFVADPTLTVFVDGSNVAYTSADVALVGGTINVQAPVSAPAPPGLLLALTGAGCLGGLGWVRRRTPAPAT
jgi:hypothetical protein